MIVTRLTPGIVPTPRGGGGAPEVAELPLTNVCF